MTCAWESFLQILPPWLRKDVDKLGKDGLLELRLRKKGTPELVLTTETVFLERMISFGDLDYCIQAASRYSPWAADTVNQGYVTAPGGHRLGICGTAVYKNGVFSGIREVTSLCIRVARDFSGLSEGVRCDGSLLILGAPGWGKTTLLRDYIRRRAEVEPVAVVDERGELFPEGFARGKRMDVLTGAKKCDGIHRVLRTMSPRCIAVDEITDIQDCEAICRAYGCGICLVATAHAASMEEFRARAAYSELIRMGIFDTCLLLGQDRTFRSERIVW